MPETSVADEESVAEVTGGDDSAQQVARSGGRSWVLSARSALVLGVAVILMVTLALPAKAFITQRARIAQLESQLAWHTQRVADLSAAHERWSDPAYVEMQARARLHYVRPGQVGYVVITDTPSKQPETTTTRPQAQVPNNGPWWSALWSTVEDTSRPKAKNTAPAAPAPAKPAPSYGG